MTSMTAILRKERDLGADSHRRKVMQKIQGEDSMEKLGREA